MEIEHKQGRRRWRKKGFLFTLVTIFALMVFIFSLTFQSNIKIKNRMHAIESRIRTMDSFIEDFKRDFERGLYISSFRALLSIENRIVADSVFISDTKALFHEAVANGTLDGVPSPLMSGAKITDWITKIKEEAEKINIILNISVISDPSLGQDDPWYIRVSMNISYVVEDMGGIAIWNTSGEIVAQIPVQGLEDPFYIVYGEGRLTRLINESPYLNNFTWKVEEPNTWNVSHLLDHTDHSFYIHNPDAPSFLQRLEGEIDGSSACCGIESLLNLKDISDAGLPIDESSSIVDYHYWAGDGNGDKRINETPDWFRLDNAHLAIYNATKIAYD
ncbi:TPA: hypothetical protein HA361_03310 [Candidatus Woesearchaeota archaeon]|nr:hypothetical protein [Candidatus Woesearchaeota archaeon]HII68651.1 hypothetical protein [Candidatus Woesearchaeota archaeon]